VASNDFLRVGGKDVEGGFVPASPVIVSAQLPDAPSGQKRALEYVKMYEAAQGAGSDFCIRLLHLGSCLELPMECRTAQDRATGNKFGGIHKPGKPDWKLPMVRST
jgi:hypothetical protein